jgi:hypothetical protein
MLAKYLVTQSDTAEFIRLRAREVELAWTPEWPSVELLSGTALARREPTIFRDGNARCDVSASSSHCGPYSAFCISRSGRIGVDLETIEPRRQEFYKGMFSAEEREWLRKMRDDSGASVEVATTLLWSVKEAYLKLSVRNDISVWAFPRWTVWFDQDLGVALQPQTSDAFIRVFGGIRRLGFSQAFKIAVRRVDDMIFATVQCPVFGSQAQAR